MSDFEIIKNIENELGLCFKICKSELDFKNHHNSVWYDSDLEEYEDPGTTAAILYDNEGFVTHLKFHDANELSLYAIDTSDRELLYYYFAVSLIRGDTQSIAHFMDIDTLSDILLSDIFEQFKSNLKNKYNNVYDLYYKVFPLYALDINKGKSIIELKHLEYFEFSDSKANSLPDWIGELISLREIDLSGNYFETLPFCLRSLINLNEIDLSMNPLNSLPHWINEFKHLAKLNLVGTSIDIKNDRFPFDFKYLVQNQNMEYIFFKEDINIFISYSWKDNEIADTLERLLLRCNINVIRDINDIQYKDSITEFMKNIRKSNYAILIISDDYLKSHNCLFEVSELLKDDDYRKRMLPVIKKNTDIFSIYSRNKYINYLQNEYMILEESAQSIENLNRAEINRYLIKMEHLKRNFPDFLAVVSDMYSITYDENINEKELTGILRFIKKDKL